ncbi:MAG TPA: efflux RND transporter periplasmic adaptor subunit [Pirellulaceae bacterium]|nr:efflux RND transporter periplasmic adaptor subunit [Pirellulaceae bacterium]
MRTIVILAIALLAAGGIIAASYQPATNYWQMRSMPKWRTAEVSEGEIISVVNSTGTLKPVLQVSVGSFVSGPIDAEYELKDVDGKPLLDKLGQPLHLAEFNQEVRKGDQMAKIDERIYKTAVDRDHASLLTRQADLERVEAQLELANRDKNRAMDLQKKDAEFISKAEIDKFNYGWMSLLAQKKLAEASVQQAQSQLEQSQANLGYTEIKAPVDGIVINRKIDPGQTLAAQFQTPELFVVAPNMREKMHVHASVDEADIGLIHGAQQKQLPVTFTVDGYPDDLFTGEIEEIRLSSTTTQNVVTYPVLVAAKNPDLKLLPGMTASISFEVDRRHNVVKVPNSALRFFPLPRHVRKEDQPLLEGKAQQQQEEEVGQLAEATLSASERSEARRNRSRRHVWVLDGFKLKAIEVRTGLSDSQSTELISGDLKPGMKLIIGIDTTTTGWGG